MRAMLQQGVQRALFEVEGTWRHDHPENIKILRRIYFRRLDGPETQITDSGALKAIENGGLQRILDEATLERSKKAHLFAGVDAWAGIGIFGYWRWRISGSRVFGSIELFASKWPLSEDLVTPGRGRSDVAHAAHIGDVIDLSRFLQERKPSQADLNMALNYAVMSRRDNTTAIETLISAGADVNARFGDNTTLLMLTYECPCNIPVLLAHGARIEDRDKWGRTASDLAKQRHDEIATRLLQNQPPGLKQP